jgi:hypothetical protein
MVTGNMTDVRVISCETDVKREEFGICCCSCERFLCLLVMELVSAADAIIQAQGLNMIMYVPESIMPYVIAAYLSIYFNHSKYTSDPQPSH